MGPGLHQVAFVALLGSNPGIIKLCQGSVFYLENYIFLPNVHKSYFSPSLKWIYIGILMGVYRYPFSLIPSFFQQNPCCNISPIPFSGRRDGAQIKCKINGTPKTVGGLLITYKLITYKLISVTKIYKLITDKLIT